MLILPRFSTFALIFLASLTLLGCSGATTTESAARTGALIGGLSDGRVENFVESYSVTGDALILSGTFRGEPYITNAKFSIQNNQMVVVTPQVRVVLEEVEESS